MRVLLVDDHAIVRAGLRGLLAGDGRMEVCEAADAAGAMAAVRASRPDLIVLDINLPGIGGLDLLRRLLAEDDRLRVLMLSMHAEPIYATRAIEAGARGYLSKNAPPGELMAAIARVGGGGHYIENEIAQELALQRIAPAPAQPRLTARELEIVRLLAAGSSLSQIADTLRLGYKTVANACTGLKAKLGVSRTADLLRVSILLDLGVAEAPDSVADETIGAVAARPCG